MTYAVVATDNLGQTSTSASRTYRTSAGPVTRIEAIQRTPTGAPGASPFAGVTTTRLNLNAVVQAVFTSGSVRYAILQDDAALAPWTGIWANVTDLGETPPAVGDRLNITGARISESFSVTTLDQLAFTTTGTGAPYAHKVLPTGVLATSAATAEAHEGMLIRFETVVITRVNADGADDVAGFGEWAFATVGAPASNAVRADDLSDAFGPTYNLDNLAVGQGRAFIQGAWTFSFGNYKLIPVELSDVGGVIVSNEPVAGGVGALRLRAAQPNPFAGTTRIPYEVAAAGPVRLAVYDVTGREVAVLVDGVLAPSAYEATFDARGLASGVYVVRLVAGGEALSSRLTVLR